MTLEGRGRRFAHAVDRGGLRPLAVERSLRSLSRARRARRPGFTLVELLVVVGLVGVLSAIAVPSYQKLLYRARAAAIVGEFRTVRTAVYQYQADHDAWPPDNYPGIRPPELERYLPEMEFAGTGYLLDYENWEGFIGISAIAEDPRLEAALGNSIRSANMLSYRLNDRYTYLIESGP